MAARSQLHTVGGAPGGACPHHGLGDASLSAGGMTVLSLQGSMQARQHPESCADVWETQR